MVDEIKRSPFYRAFKSHYWHSIPDVPFEPDIKRDFTSEIAELINLPLAEKHAKFSARYLDSADQLLLILYRDGTIQAWDLAVQRQPALKFWGKLTAPEFVKLPSSDLIGHAALDIANLQLYVTLVDDRLGIFTINLIRFINRPEKDGDAGNFKLSYFVRGTGNRRFEGLAVDQNAQTLFCCDSKKHKAVRQWSLAGGGELPEVYIKGDLLARFAPYSLSITQALSSRMPQRYMAVSDWISSQIVIFQICGETTTFSHILAKCGSKLGQVNGPRLVSFDAAGNLFVADCSNRRFQMFSRKSVTEADNNSSKDDAEKVVWHYQLDVGNLDVPLAVTTALTSDASPRPIVCLAFRQNGIVDDSKEKYSVIRFATFTVEKEIE